MTDSRNVLTFVYSCHVLTFYIRYFLFVFYIYYLLGDSVARLACWTQAQKGLGSNRSRDAVGNRLRQTVHTHCASVNQAAKLAAALLRVAGVTAGLAEK